MTMRVTKRTSLYLQFNNSTLAWAHDLDIEGGGRVLRIRILDDVDTRIGPMTPGAECELDPLAVDEPPASDLDLVFSLPGKFPYRIRRVN
jgi:hypothetical protein